jgi:hypothetical protein
MIAINLTEPTQAHKAISGLWTTIKNELTAGHKQVIELKSFEEALTGQQRRYFHGYVLTTIAQTATVDGRKYAMPVWKEFYRSKFLGDEVVEVTDIKTGATKKELRRKSSESLSVKGYNKLIDQVTADAATEFGVVFDVNFDQWMEREQA